MCLKGTLGLAQAFGLLELDEEDGMIGNAKVGEPTDVTEELCLTFPTVDARDKPD